MALQKQQLLLPHEVRSFEEPAAENGTPWSGSATGAECAPTVCTYVHVDVFVWKGRLVHLLYHRRCRTKPQFRHEAFVCHSESNGDGERRWNGLSLLPSLLPRVVLPGCLAIRWVVLRSWWSMGPSRTTRRARAPGSDGESLAAVERWNSWTGTVDPSGFESPLPAWPVP